MRDIGHHDIPDDISLEDLTPYASRSFDNAMTWKYFDWLRSITSLPLLVKGVLSQKDAQKAVPIGLDGIVVSNHGGRMLDGMPATIDVVESIVETVKGRAEILMDSGVRRGTDVLNALALGARAVLVGRPYVWGLAAGGESGVKLALDMLRTELHNAMSTSGCAGVADIEKNVIRCSG